jgi:hypothetical protein
MFALLMFWLLFNQCILAKTDCYWLVIIYYKMAGHVRGMPLDCCRMTGVECSQDGHIINIRWHGLGATGSIPPEIGNLVNLQNL